MQMAIDVGYSHVKAVTPDGRKIIPSVVAPYQELALADLYRNGTGHAVEIKIMEGPTSRHFVGDLALREGHAASFTLDRKKHRHPNHDVLIMTAVKLLGDESSINLAVGLPVAYYREQKEELKQHLEKLQAEVSVDGGRPEKVSFERVVVYPQGAGALLTAQDLPTSGTVLLVDIGQKTTDYVTAETADGKVKPVSSLCGSVETGVHAVNEAVAHEFQTQTGAPLAAVRVAEVVSCCGQITYFGKDMDLSVALEKARDDVARAIADQVQAALGDRFAFVRRVYLAGGGAEALPLLANLFPTVQILPDPQWANAYGFLKVVSG